MKKERKVPGNEERFIKVVEHIHNYIPVRCHIYNWTGKLSVYRYHLFIQIFKKRQKVGRERKRKTGSEKEKLEVRTCCFTPRGETVL